LIDNILIRHGLKNGRKSSIKVKGTETIKVQIDYYIYLAGLGSDFAIEAKTKLKIDKK